MPNKNERGTRYGMLHGKTGKKPFWFSSLGQIVQFGAIIFCRTSKNYFGQFVWIEKKSHYDSRVSFHEAPTKNCSETRKTFREREHKKIELTLKEITIQYYLLQDT